MHDDGTTLQDEWPPNQQEDFKCTIIIHYQEKYISKYTIEIYKTAKGGSRSHYSWDYTNFCTNISELFAPIDGKSKPKTILIEGISGIGKTLLLRQITSEWKNIDFLREKDYVFLLNLWDPEVKKIFDVHGMIEYIFKYDYDMQMYGIKQIENYICETNGSCLAVILDSDKEVRLDTNARMNSFFTNLIERKVAVLSECLILITSPYSDCKQLHYHVCRRVEMLGFSEDHKEEYLAVAFQGSPDKYRQLKKHIQNNPTIDVLCRIQLHLSFLVYLHNENIRLPTTQTKFFEKFVCYTFSCCLGLGKFDNLSQLESKHVKIVKELGNYSLELLKKDKFTFSLKDLKENCPKYWHLVEPSANPCLCGLLKKMQHFSSREATYSFLHLRVHEYLAAYHLSRRNRDFNNHFKQFFGYVNMCVLFYGITKETGGGCFCISSTGNEDIKHDRAKDLLSDSSNNQLKCLQLFQCCKEDDDKKMCSRIRNSLGDKISFSGHHMLPENMITLCFAITQSSEYCNLTTLDLTDCKIGDSSCTYFYQQLKYCYQQLKCCLPYSSLTISSLILSHNQLTQSSVNQIIELTIRLEIKVLDLSNNHFSDVEADMLVKKCHCLNFLNLIDNNINNADEQSINIFYNENMANFSIAFTRECLVFQQDNINDFTAYNISVKSLFMDCREVGYNQHINQFLQKATSLKVLHLRTQSKFDARILNFCKIEELCVSQLSDEDADYCIKESANKSNFIIMITSKSKFYARYVQNDKMLNLALTKCNIQSICEIDIFSCNFDIKYLAKALTSKMNFTSVSMKYCDIVQLAMCDCKLEDTHIYQLQNALIQHESNRLSVLTLDLSNNYLKSPDVIELACLLHIQELRLTNNQLQIQDTTMITDVLADENCHANYIDLQNNRIVNVKDLCKKLFFVKDFNFNLIGTDHGCIITKRLHFKIQHGTRVNSLFFAFTDQLEAQEFQNFFQSINSSEIVELNTLYIVMLQHKNWYRISEKIKFPVTDELYLCVPDMDTTNLEFFWRYKCKSKLILSREGLKALHIEDSEILCKTLDYVTENSKEIILESSNVCYTTIKNLARVLSKFNNSNNKRWDILKLYNCSISDDHMEYFYETFVHCKKHGKILIKSVNLSKNKISHQSMGMINQLLEEWKVEELMIAENDLKSNGLLMLLHNNHITMNLRVLDTHQNKEDVNFHKEIQCFEGFICNKETTFAHLTNKVLIVDGSVFTDLNNHELKMKTEVTSIYLKFNAMKQDKSLSNIEKYLLSLKSLEVMFISISGVIAGNNKFLSLIKKVSVTDKLIISAVESNFKPIIKPNCTTCISSRENLYIANSSDNNIFEQLLNYTCINKSCEIATSISLKNCNNISNHSIKILANGLIDANRKEKNLHLLEINNSSLVHTHIHEFCNTLTHNLTSITSTIKVLDLSNNYLDTNCMEDLILVVSILHVEELLLNNNQLQEDDMKQIMKVLTDSNDHLNYIDLQNNSLNNMENYFEKVFFFHNFSFSIISTNSVITTDGGCIITRSRLSCLNMQRAKVNCLYIAIRDGLADPDLQELSQTLAPPTRVNRLYIAVLQSASLYHILKTIEHLTVLVSEDLYLCIPEMDSAIADRLRKHQCKSKLILSRKILHAENVKDSKVICKTLDYVDDNINYLYFIKCVLTTEILKKLQPHNYVEKLHLVGQLNMNAKEFVEILNNIHTDELLLVANNFTYNEAVDLFNSASRSIVIAGEDTILGKYCTNGELINTALMYSTSPYYKQIHFTNCDLTEYIEGITSQLLKFHKTVWRHLKIEHCKVDDNACTRLVRVLCTAKTHIESISFSGNLLTSSSVEAISNIINNLKVTELCLNNNKYSLEDVEHIFNAIMMTYNIEKLNFEQNEIDGLLLNEMIKNKFLSFKFDVCELQYNCHILACSNPNQWHFYKFYIDSTESMTNVSYISNSQLQIEKIYVNAKTLQSLETLENDVYFLSKKISEVCIINKSTLSDFIKQQLNKEAILNIKLVLSSKFVTTLELLQTQGDIDLPCLTVLVSHKCGNPEGLVSKSISLMPEISLVHILVLPFSDVNNEIEKILLDLTNITSIRLFEMHIKKELKIHSALICKLLTNAKDLEAFNLSHNNLESPEIAHISTGIKDNTSLRSVNFSYNNITVNDRETLMIALMNKNIKEINISNNPIYYLELRMITKLTTLDLSYTYLGIDDENITNLKEIMDNNVNLQVLNLSGNNIGDKMKLLVVPPLKNKSLKCFSISNNDITYRGAVCISNIIQQNLSLQDFNISYNPLSSKHTSKCGIIKILEGLKSAELRSFDLSYTKIKNSTAVNNLSKAIKSFSTLEKINISGCKISCSTILRAMETMSSFKALGLENCNITHKDVDAISNLINRNPNLQLLNVNKNKITTVGFESILRALLAHDISQIKTLKVAENDIALDKPLHILGRMNAKLHLEHLDVSDNKNIKVTTILYLLDHFIDVCFLKSLNICRSYDAKDHDNAKILYLLANSAKNLEYVNLSGYRFTRDSLQNFQDHIHLTHINISDCGITEDIANIIAKNNLLKFDTLDSLDLSNSGPATPIFCSFIKNIHTIKLQRCDISVTSLDALLCYDSTICVLHLCHNNLANKKQVPSPFTRLVQYLSKPVNKSLKELCLHSCELSTMDAAEIIKALKENNTLKCLNLNNNHILCKPTLLNDVENSLGENSCLEQICLIGKKMTADIAKLMIHCGKHSISINRMEFPLMKKKSKLKEDIKRGVEIINKGRARDGYFTPLHLVFIKNFEVYNVCT